MAVYLYVVFCYMCVPRVAPPPTPTMSGDERNDATCDIRHHDVQHLATLPQVISRHFTAYTPMFHMVRDYFIDIRSDCTSSVTTRTSCLQQRRLAGAPARLKTRCF